MEPIMSKPKYVARKINDLKDMLEQSVALYSDKDAFIKKSKEIHVGVTYKKYKEDVFALGTELINRNIKGERVVIISENRYEWCVSFMAIACSEGIIVPVSQELSSNDLASKINETKAKFIIFSENSRELVKEIRKKCPSLEYTIDMDTIIDDKENLSLLRLIELGNKSISSGDNTIAKLEIDKNTTATIFYEDTIVKDRGVMLTHKSIVSNIMGLVSFIYINNEDKSIIFDSINKAYDCIYSFLTILAVGGTINFSESEKTIKEELKENNPSILFLRKNTLESLYEEIWNTFGNMPNIRKIRILMLLSTILIKLNIDIRKKVFKDILKNFGKNLNTIIVTGNNIDYKILRDFSMFGLNIIFGYEILEASSIIMINSKKEYIKENTIGLPLPGLKASILNSNGRVPGELTLKGDFIMEGYYNDKKASAKVLKDGILYTGKIFYRDKNGCFYLSKSKTK